jgi:transcriptional regulator with XRE-family HTH domain
MSTEPTVGERIRFYRKIAGLRQTELARTLGVSKAAVCMWEKNRFPPSLAALRRITTALGVTLRTFFGDIPSGAAK